MADPNLEFTNVTNLRAEALGEPGHRTFRVLVDSSSSSAVIWLEKEQLFQLALALNQLLISLPEESSGRDTEQGESGPTPPANLEFTVGKLVLGHDGAKEKIVIDAHDVESGEEAPPSVRVWGDRAQVRAFAEEALRECAAGRPICPLCGGPMDPTGHRCPRTNGPRLQELKGL